MPDLRPPSLGNASLRRLNMARLCGVLLAGVFLLAAASTARADFRLCNQTPGRVGIALGYKDKQGWITEGWWNLPSKACETLLRGTLVARYYYIYAVDYDRGGEWSGHAFMCTKEKEFTIRGTEDCLARGFDRTGFFEVDTGEQRSWTVQLTDAEQRQGRQPTQSGEPRGPGSTSSPTTPPRVAPPSAAPPSATPPGAANPSAGQPARPDSRKP